MNEDEGTALGDQMDPRIQVAEVSTKRAVTASFPLDLHIIIIGRRCYSK